MKLRSYRVNTQPIPGYKTPEEAFTKYQAEIDLRFEGIPLEKRMGIEKILKFAIAEAKERNRLAFEAWLIATNQPPFVDPKTLSAEEAEAQSVRELDAQAEFTSIDDLKDYQEEYSDHTVARVTPVWVSNIHQWLTGNGIRDDLGVIGDLEKDRSIVVPFALLEKDSFSIKFQTTRLLYSDGDTFVSLLKDKPITARYQGQLYQGFLWKPRFFSPEKELHFVRLKGAPQALTDLVAAVVSKAMLDDIPENLSTYLGSTSKCVCCARPLKDEISKAIGLGPDCAQSYAIPHTIEAANRISAQRAAYQSWLQEQNSKLSHGPKEPNSAVLN